MTHVSEFYNKVPTLEDLAKLPDSAFRNNMPPILVRLERARLQVTAAVKELKRRRKAKRIKK